MSAIITTIIIVVVVLLFTNLAAWDWFFSLVLDELCDWIYLQAECNHNLVYMKYAKYEKQKDFISSFIVILWKVIDKPQLYL